MHDMDISQTDRILVENFEPELAPMRIAVVTETWPPEVNGVALTLSKLIHLLNQRNHTIQLIRPKQDKHDAGSDQAGWPDKSLEPQKAGPRAHRHRGAFGLVSLAGSPCLAAASDI